MKPIFITMQGFGSYIHSTTINFSDLGKSPIFLITGATGSGKTTILDAMCFALYCKATGNRRSWASMRSTAAEDGLYTSVDFCFSLGSKVYRFFRSQSVYYVRGSGRRDIREEHLCYRLSDGCPADETAQWELILSGSESKIRDYAQQLLGLTCEQFSQVIVLPQGDFLKLLRANSNNKAEILQTLFSTQLWTQITNKMKQYTNALLQEVEQLLTTKTTLLEREEVDTIETLQQKCQQYESNLKNSQAQLKKLQQIINKQTEQLSKAKEQKQRFSQYQTLIQRQQQLQQLAPSINEKRKTLSLAKQIEQLYPYWKNYHDIHQTLEEKQTLYQSSEQALQAAQEQFYKTKEQQDVIKQKKAGIPKLEQTVVQLETTLQLVQRIETLNEEKTAVTKIIASNQAEQSKTEAQIATATENIEKGNCYLQEIEKELQLLPSYLEQLHILESYEQQLTLLLQAQQEHNEAEQKFHACSSIKQEKESVLADTKKQVSSLQADIMEHTAAQMAQTLKENTPCPVCGSLDHPVPFAGTPEQQANTAQLSALTDKLEKLQTDYQQYLQIYSRRQTLLDEKTNTLKECRTKCAQIPIDAQGLALQLEAQRNKIKKAEHKVNLHEKAEQRIAQRKEELHILEQTRDAQKEIGIQQEQRLASIKAAIGELKGSTEQRLDPKEINKQLSETRQTLQTLQKDIAHWDTQFLNASSHLAAQQTNAELAKSAWRETAEKEYKSKQTFYEQLILTNLSESINISSDLASMRIVPQKIQLLEQELQNYTTQTQSVEDQLASLAKELKGKTVPQIEQLEQELFEKQTAQEQMAQQLGSYTQHLHTSQKTLKQLLEITHNSKETQDAYEQASRLSQLLSGGNTKKIPLQQFVLSIMLDDILTYANEFFSLLSRGRYNLKRLEGTTGGNAKSGLDLEVLDGFTGAPRSIETLSGGEQFLASLSLAFGLSDVVQSYSGSVRLDSIFIDEGFGSLDQDTLDTAMKAFDQIQKMGRTIGIISHVSELKNRIATQIYVHPSKYGGSSIKIIKKC